VDIFKSVDKVKPFLEYTWKRHKILSSNIANADTPNYKAKDVVFNLEKEADLKVTRYKHIKPVSQKDFKVVEIKRGLIGNDLNNVSVEEEMAKMAQNKLAYEVYMRIATGSLEKLDRVIKEGR